VSNNVGMCDFLEKGGVLWLPWIIDFGDLDLLMTVKEIWKNLCLIG
jgi:hypothetical protein